MIWHKDYCIFECMDEMEEAVGSYIGANIIAYTMVHRHPTYTELYEDLELGLFVKHEDIVNALYFLVKEGYLETFEKNGCRVANRVYVQDLEGLESMPAARYYCTSNNKKIVSKTMKEVLGFELFIPQVEEQCDT